jgi:hypothetical protein
MVQKIESLSDCQIGDAVRFRTGPRSGERGTLAATTPELAVRMENGELVNATVEQLTDLSLAARRAWSTRPKQAGRPAAETRKKMVSMRIDEKLWDRLGQAVSCGLISSREHAVNAWLAEHVTALNWDGCES